MDFVLALHSHLPWVLHHGRWPHGSDWLCEAAVDTYLPLVETLMALERDGVASPVTLGVTPVLANQLAHPSFASELEAFFAQRLATCAEAPEALASTNDAVLIPLVQYWQGRLTRLRDLFRGLDGNLIAALKGLEERGRIEVFSSAATHGFLPLLGRDESIQLQLRAGRAEHRRLFGRDPSGCWVPECAFRPSGPWGYPGSKAWPLRRGTDEHLRDAGYHYFFVDANLVDAGSFLGQYHEIPLGAERFDARRHGRDTMSTKPAIRTPYRAYRMPGKRGQRPLLALVRDPKSSMQVWSRALGYPGDPWYLEFHKIRWPGGLKLWRVTSGDADLGAKLPYDPAAARSRAHTHAQHFAGVLVDTEETQWDGRVIAAPFDTELFGHWWFEGVDFIGDLYRALQGSSVHPALGRDHAATRMMRDVVRLGQGSWGANGDFSMWMNDETRWTWQRLWPLEDTYWKTAPLAIEGDERRQAVLAQATRSLLLAQSSDWQFIISTGAAGDYATKRFLQHCEDAEFLLSALAPDAEAARLDEAVRAVQVMRARDDLFPDVLEAVRETLA